MIWRKSQIFGGVFTLLLGSLLHFTYEWTGENAWMGLFSAVNESTWEHLKLLVMPMLLFGVAEYAEYAGYAGYGKRVANFVPVRALSILLGMAVIVTGFYTYVGIVGTHFLWADILTFALGVGAAYGFSTRALGGKQFSSKRAGYWGWALLFLLLASFFVFTFYPPPIGLFSDRNQ